MHPSVLDPGSSCLQCAAFEALDQTALTLKLIGRLSQARREAVFEEQRVGVHVRHILDHYATFLAALDSGTMDYGQRRRGGPEERDCRAARARLDRLRSDLAHRLWRDGDVTVISRPLSRSNEPVLLRSSLCRELDFVNSHAVHHLAIIRCLCLNAAVRLPEYLGVAPETRHFEAGLMAQGEGD